MLRSPMGPQLGGWQSILGRAVRERRQELELCAVQKEAVR